MSSANPSSLVERPLNELKPRPRNARTHSKKQLRQIARSIEAFGFTAPVLIDENDVILAGHGRVLAAELLGLKTAPCRRIDHLSETEKRAYLLADNKLAINAGWDEEILAAELGELQLMGDIDLQITGFSIPEIDNFIDGAAPQEPGDPRDDAIPEEAPRRCHTGDLWRLGRHRLVCGDSLDPGVVKHLMDGARARMVFTDPPYNVPINGHVSGLGKIKHAEFVMASGEMSPSEFTNFLKRALELMAKHSLDGAVHYICMDWRHMREILDAGETVYSELKNLIVWAKDVGGMGTFYRSRHELIFAFKIGSAPHVNSFELGQHGRYRTNVWNYRGVNSMKAGRAEELAMHPTVKPVEMIADAIRDVSARGEIVLDLFGGAGSTLIAAEKTGRRAFLSEISPAYCDRILARWETYTKDDAEKLIDGAEQLPKPEIA